MVMKNRYQIINYEELKRLEERETYACKFTKSEEKQRD